jgi:phage recombination protein Bet
MSAPNTLPALAMNEAQLATVLENSLYPGASPQSIVLAINYCQAAGLDPMQKPVHIVPMWDNKASRMRDVIMPGVGLYRTQAARTGQYAGVTEPEYGPDVTENIGGQQITFPAWCKVTVKRLLPNGSIVDFSATERWKENYAVKGGKDKSVAPNAMWTRRPYGQIAKCAEAQALRKAFPEMTGSQLTADEMEGREIDITAAGETLKPEPKAPPAAYPQEHFDKNIEGWHKLIAAGKKTADQVIAMANSKAPLTTEQIAAIRNTPAEAAASSAQASTGAPAGAPAASITFAQIESAMRKAQNADVLDEAADLIGEVSDPQQRTELMALYNKRKEEFQA